MNPERRRFLSEVGLSALGVLTFRIGRVSAQRKESITLAAAGDCIITRKLSVLEHPAFRKLVSIFRDSDVGFGNCEMTIHDLQGYPAPTGSCGDLDLMTEPAMAEELAGAGFNMMALANNHSGDYGAQGLLATIGNLERAGIVSAGAGGNLARARAPGFRDVQAGRVALVACASSFRPGTEASPSHAAIPGRPGLSPLRTSRIYRLRRDRIESIRRMKEDLARYLSNREEEESEKSVTFLGNRFEEAAEAGIRMEARPGDVAEILAQVRRARAEADLVLVSIHAHDSGASREEPADFLPPFARACIEAGADIFLGHGPHVLRGAEIHGGKPIFYSLGNFLFPAETIRQIPAEIYKTCGIDSLSPSDFFAKVMGRMFEQPVFWESVVPRICFEKHECTRIDLYPVDLRYDLPPTQRGTPQLAATGKGQKILERFTALSRPFGTEITIEQGRASVALPAG